MKRIFVISLFLLSVMSCISFKFQRMTWSYNKETDTLKIFQEYEGIYTPNGKVTAQELKQYQNLMKSRNSYFFNNWIFEYPGLKIDDAVSKVKDQELKEFFQLLKDSVNVQNGDFYTNEDGELCGWQKVTVKNTSKIFELGNKQIRKLFEKEAKEKGDFYLLKPPGMKYVEIKGNQLIYRHPMPYEEFQKSKSYIMNEVLKQLLDEEESKNKDKIDALLYLLSQDVQINYERPFIEVILGKPEQKINTVESGTFMEGDYNDAFKKKVAEDYTVKKGLDETQKESFFK